MARHLVPLVFAFALACDPASAPEPPCGDVAVGDDGTAEPASSTGDPSDTPTAETTTNEPDEPPSPDTGHDVDPPPVPTPLRLMSFNIKHAELSDLESIAAIIAAERPDVVALQEVDKDAARSGDEFQSYRLGQLVGTASLFRQAITLDDGGEYGLAILSRHPILSSSKVMLPSSGEQRVLVVVDVAIGDRVVPIGITHLGLDGAERQGQVAAILDTLGDASDAVLLGDLNAMPDEPAIGALAAVFHDAWADAGVGDGFTIPAEIPDRRIDYVLLGSAWQTATAARVLDTQVSDHRPLVVDAALAPL